MLLFPGAQLGVRSFLSPPRLGVPRKPMSTSIEANRDTFDNLAATYESRFPGWLKTAEDSSKEILQQYNFNVDTTEMMDFACGTGLMSQHLIGSVRSILGIDVSEKMVEAYNQKMERLDDAKNKAKAIQMDIMRDYDATVDGMKFHIIVCGQAFHHIEDIQGVTTKLVSLLKTGGSLFVVDVVKSPQSIQWHTNPRGDRPPAPSSLGQNLHHLHPQGGHGHGRGPQDQQGQQIHSHDDSHGEPTRGGQDARHSIEHVGGLTEPEIRAILEHAKLIDITYTVIGEYTIGGLAVELFVAGGVNNEYP